MGDEGREAVTDAPPRASRGWLLAAITVLGVVLLGALVAGAVSLVSSAGEALQDAGQTTPVQRELDAKILGPVSDLELPSGSATEQGVFVVEEYIRAWDEVDCDLYAATTTAAFRESIAVTTCRAFNLRARDTAHLKPQVEVVDAFPDSSTGEVLVVTAESYIVGIYDVVDEGVYYLVRGGSGWVVDGATAEQIYHERYDDAD